MQQQTLERRLELLKDEGYGYFRKEIVERLSLKYECAKSTIYHDFATKPVWQPLVMEVKNALLTIVNRHEQLYRKAALTYVQAENNAQKIAAISLLKTINLDAFEMLQSTGQIVKVPEKVEADITKRQVIIHMWKPENARPRNNDTLLPSA